MLPRNPMAGSVRAIESRNNSDRGQNSIPMRAPVTAIFMLASLLLAIGEKPGIAVDHVIVYKHERRLVLLSQGKELKSYRIARWRTQWAEDEAGRPSHSRGFVRTRFTKRQQPFL